MRRFFFERFLKESAILADMKTSWLFRFFFSFLLCSLCACGTSGGGIKTAQSIAQSASSPLVEQELLAPPFRLAAWGRLTNAAIPLVRVYIEGDGRAWLSRSVPSADPTPHDPVALRLAAADSTPNVFYLARPCQFIRSLSDGTPCPRDYWMGKRFAPEVIESYNNALSQIAQRAADSSGMLPQLELIGYSGGAAVAGLLAARRADVASLRTVVGNVDNAAFTRLHKVSPMPNSLNMADYADALSHVAQYHFIAQDDSFVPIDILQSYESKIRMAMGGAAGTACLKKQRVFGTTHLTGWENQWSQLLALMPEKPSCVLPSPL